MVVSVIVVLARVIYFELSQIVKLSLYQLLIALGGTMVEFYDQAGVTKQ